jgi:hypothetical protein
VLLAPVVLRVLVVLRARVLQALVVLRVLVLQALAVLPERVLGGGAPRIALITNSTTEDKGSDHVNS